MQYDGINNLILMLAFFFVLPFVMELLSSLLRIVLGILSVNIKMFQMTF